MHKTGPATYPHATCLFHTLHPAHAWPGVGYSFVLGKDIYGYDILDNKLTGTPVERTSYLAYLSCQTTSGVWTRLKNRVMCLLISPDA